MRVVISGYYGYGNAGDEWSLAGMLRSLRREMPDLVPVVLSGDAAATERMHGVTAVPGMSPRAVAGAIRAADGLISGGGSLLQDVTSARPVTYYTGVMQLASLLGRRYAIYAQGLGPLRRRLNRRIAGRALGRAAYVSLRDDGSVDLARRLGYHGPIDVVPDPALALTPRSAPRGTHLVVAARSWRTGVRYVDALRRALAILAADRPVVALPMQEPADRAVALALANGIPGAAVVDAASTLDDRMHVITSAACVVGMRLHALVLAAASGTPAVAISYDPKIDAFASYAGLPLAGDVRARLDTDDVVRAVAAAVTMDPGAYARRIDALRLQVQWAARSTLRAIG